VCSAVCLVHGGGGGRQFCECIFLLFPVSSYPIVSFSFEMFKWILGVLSQTELPPRLSQNLRIQSESLFSKLLSPTVHSSQVHSPHARNNRHNEHQQHSIIFTLLYTESWLRIRQRYAQLSLSSFFPESNKKAKSRLPANFFSPAFSKAFILFVHLRRVFTQKHCYSLRIEEAKPVAMVSAAGGGSTIIIIIIMLTDSFSVRSQQYGEIHVSFCWTTRNNKEIARYLSHPTTYIGRVTTYELPSSVSR
jgi:hypothetical protein